MSSEKIIGLMVLLLTAVSAFSLNPNDSTLNTNVSILNTDKKQIYNSTQVKVDILSPVLTPALYKWKMQHYELGVNVRLAQRFYPTLEAGYTGGRITESDSITYSGHGGFFRVGADINPLKKHPESPHALLVGLRIGSGYQAHKADCWGEIVAGCQVCIAEVRNTAFYMGWMGRVKFLFTRATEDKNGNAYPTYIPGFGDRANIGWGANYYLGWRF